MRVRVFVNTNGFQHLSFFDFVQPGLHEQHTMMTMCGLPVTPFDCDRMLFRRVDTLDVLLERLIESLAEDGITVLFTACRDFLSTCLHQLAWFRSQVQQAQQDVRFLVGTSFDHIHKLAPLCKANNVNVRTTRRIREIKMPMAEPRFNSLSSLITQYGASALMARVGFREDSAHAHLALHEQTRGADVYLIESAELGTFLLLVFAHADLARDAHYTQSSWWPLHVQFLNAHLFKQHSTSCVGVTRVSAVPPVRVDNDVDETLIEFLS